MALNTNILSFILCIIWCNRELAMAGANVVMACRNVDAANRIYEQWRAESQNGKALNVKVTHNLI